MTDHPAVICAARETRPDGNYECVRPPEHPEHAHYWVKLCTGRRGG
jgi:hypothetical protein